MACVKKVPISTADHTQQADQDTRSLFLQSQSPSLVLSFTIQSVVNSALRVQPPEVNRLNQDEQPVSPGF